MVTIGEMMTPIGPDVVQPGSVMLYQKRRSQRMAVERWRPRARRRSVAKRILLEIRGLNAKSRSHCSSCRSVDSCAIHQELCEHVLLFHIVPYFLFFTLHIFAFSGIYVVLFSHFHFRMPKDPSFQRVFGCEIWLRYSREQVN